MTMLKTILTIFTIAVSLGAAAQVEDAGGVRRSSGSVKSGTAPATAASDRMRYAVGSEKAHDADLKYMREVYRRLDLGKAPNAALIYSDASGDADGGLFGMILRLVAQKEVPAYEFLDGKEIFTDRYRIKPGEMLDRFGIYAQPAKGSTGPDNAHTIEEADIPADQVSDFYIIERWEFDRRSNRMKTRVEAVCPVLRRSGDFGDEARFPMFWVRLADLRPWLAAGTVAVSDDNNMERYTFDDFFTLGLYEGEIYKTRNLRNLSMAQMYPDEDDRRRAQDSIDNRLHTYGKNLWVPSREEYLAMKENEARKASSGLNGDSIPERTIVTASDIEKATSSRAAKKKAKKAKKSSRKAKVSSSSGTSSRSAERSVRRRKR